MSSQYLKLNQKKLEQFVNRYEKESSSKILFRQRLASIFLPSKKSKTILDNVIKERMYTSEIDNFTKLKLQELEKYLKIKIKNIKTKKRIWYCRNLIYAITCSFICGGFLFFSKRNLLWILPLSIIYIIDVLKKSDRFSEKIANYTMLVDWIIAYKLRGNNKDGKVKQQTIEYLGAVEKENQKMVTTNSTKVTLSEYLKYDDGTDKRYELVNGELLVINPPAKRHFNIIRFLVRLFEDEISRQGLDIEVIPGIGVRTGLASSCIPDVSLVDGEEWCNLADDDSAVMESGVLLAVEVVLKDTASHINPGAEQKERDYVDKVSEYHSSGLAEYWIVDPISLKITVLVLEKEGYHKIVVAGDDAIASGMFPQLKVTAASILSA